ncbi:hypothetical protein B566_EDAN006799 [Ephemera danica]|nr:hypothetical protein B566_EDAN006799 [Ephemera danica]
MTSRQVILEGGSPWGFRMHGGVDVGQSLRISRVNPGSKAAQRGVREGDIISVINNQPTCNLANEEAHSLLRTSSNVLLLGLNQDTSVKRRAHRQARPLPEQELQTDLKPAAANATRSEPSDIGEAASFTLSPLPQRSEKLESTKARNNATSTTNTSYESTKSHRTHGGGKHKRNRRAKARKKSLRAQQSICDPVNVEICEPVWEAITEIVPLPETANASLLLSAEALCWNDDEPDLFSKDEIQEVVEYHTSYNDYHNPKRKAKFKRGADQFCSSLPRLEVIAEEETCLEDVPICLQDQECSDHGSSNNATENGGSCQTHAVSNVNSFKDSPIKKLQTEADHNKDVTQHGNCTQESSNNSEGQSISPTRNDDARKNVNQISHSLPEEEQHKAYNIVINNERSVSDMLEQNNPTDVNDKISRDNEPNSSSLQENLNPLFCNEPCILDDMLCNEVGPDEDKQKSISDVKEIWLLSELQLEYNDQQTNVSQDVNEHSESRKIMEGFMNKDNILMSDHNSFSTQSNQQLHDDLCLSDKNNKKLLADLQMVNPHHSMSDSPINRYQANDVKYPNKYLSSFPQDSNSINSLHGLYKSASDNLTTEIDEEETTSQLLSNNFSLVSNKSNDTSLIKDFASDSFSAMITPIVNAPMSLRLLCVKVMSRLPNGLKLMLDWGLATIDELDLRIKSQLNIESAELLLPVVNAAAPQAPPPQRSAAAATNVADTTRAFHGTQGWLSVQAFGPYFVWLSPSQQRSLPKLPHVSAERAASLLDMHCKVSRRRAYYEPNYMGLHQEQRLKTTVLSDWLTYAKSDHRREQSPLTRFEKIDGDDINHGTTPVVANSIREIARKFEAQRYHISKQRDIAVEIQGQKLETNVKKDNEDYISKNNPAVSCTIDRPNENDTFCEKMYSEGQQQMAEYATCRQNKILHLTSPNSANPSPEEMQLEVLAEFANRARTRMEKLGLTEDDAAPAVPSKQALSELPMSTTEGGATQHLSRIHKDTTQRSLDGE